MPRQAVETGRRHIRDLIADGDPISPQLADERGPIGPIDFEDPHAGHVARESAILGEPSSSSKSVGMGGRVRGQGSGDRVGVEKGDWLRARRRFAVRRTLPLGACPLFQHAMGRRRSAGNSGRTVPLGRRLLASSSSIRFARSHMARCNVGSSVTESCRRNDGGGDCSSMFARLLAMDEKTSIPRCKRFCEPWLRQLLRRAIDLVRENGGRAILSLRRELVERFHRDLAVRNKMICN